MSGKIIGWAVKGVFKGIEMAMKHGKIEAVQPPAPIKYRGVDGEKYALVSVVDHEALGDGTTLLIVGESVTEEEAKKIEDAIISGAEIGYFTQLKMSFADKKENFRIIEKNMKKYHPDYKEAMGVGYAYGGLTVKKQSKRKELSKYFKKKQKIKFGEDREGTFAPRVPEKDFKGGEYFLKFEILEGIFSKSWNTYVAPRYGISRTWERVRVINKEGFSEFLKKAHEIFRNKERAKEYRRMVGDIRKYLKALVEGKV